MGGEREEREKAANSRRLYGNVPESERTRCDMHVESDIALGTRRPGSLYQRQVYIRELKRDGNFLESTKKLSGVEKWGHIEVVRTMLQRYKRSWCIRRTRLRGRERAPQAPAEKKHP